MNPEGAGSETPNISTSNTNTSSNLNANTENINASAELTSETPHANLMFTRESRINHPTGSIVSSRPIAFSRWYTIN